MNTDEFQPCWIIITKWKVPVMDSGLWDPWSWRFKRELSWEHEASSQNDSLWGHLASSDSLSGSKREVLFGAKNGLRRNPLSSETWWKIKVIRNKKNNMKKVRKRWERVLLVSEESWKRRFIFSPSLLSVLVWGGKMVQSYSEVWVTGFKEGKVVPNELKKTNNGAKRG